MIKDYTSIQRVNLNVSGGVNGAQYYFALTANKDNGVLREQKGANFSNNIKSYQIRSNVNVKLTSTTEAILRTPGDFDDFTGPAGGGFDSIR